MFVVSGSVETAAPERVTGDQRVAEGRSTNAAYSTCQSVQFVEESFGSYGDATSKVDAIVAVGPICNEGLISDTIDGALRKNECNEA